MMTQCRIRYGDDEVDADGDELALSAFGGKCYNCGEIVHRANKCPNPKKKRGGGKYTGKCHGCGKTGHRQENCWENKKMQARGLHGTRMPKKRDSCKKQRPAK
eukprot:5372312-Ditylum_brightwellii.AAC.1